MAHAVSEEDLSEEFAMFGVEIDSEHVIAKLQELCTLHRLDAGSIATEWMAYKHSKKNVALALEMLEAFERERLSKKNQKTPKGIKKEKPTPAYNMDSLPMDIEGAEELYTAYGGLTPNSKGAVSNKRQHTPENMNFNKRLTGPNRTPAVPFSPASFSPASATPAKKYNSRNNRGETVVNHGVTNTVKWQGTDQTVSVEHFNSEQSLSRNFKYMFQKLSEKFRVLDAIIEDMADHLKAEHKIEDFSHVALPTQEDVTVAGRICCDCNGKLNAKSVLLEGSVDMSSGKTIPVDLTKMKEYSLFPGQVVAMDGLNNTGKSFIASKLYDSVPLPLPDVTGSDPGTTRLSVLIAAGPYTTSDSLSYEPLTDLVQQIQSVKPDVCILMGPFVDSKNAEIENGRLNVTYDDLFKSQMEQIAKATEKLGTKIIVLPSHRDVHHDMVYPQPPFRLEKEYKHIQMMSDPCTLKINDIVFGLTSTDVLFDLGAEEISFPPGGSDRLGRLAQHLLNQHSYYPLYPPNEDVCIDYEQFYQYCNMPVTPHILVIPSEFKQFIKDIKGCCCINPGRLTKGLTGSTFAKLLIQVNNLKSNQSIVPNITAQIIRI